MLDEKSALQRQREAEAEAKLAAKKASLGTGSRIPERGPPIRLAERNESADRSTSTGPPRLNLSGNRPTWREREEAKRAQQTDASASPAAAATEPKPEESSELKKTSGYLPPAKRGLDAGPPARGRQDGPPSDGASDASAKWRPRRPEGFKGGRDISTDDARPISSDGRSQAEGSPEPLRKPAPGKFVPPHLRKLQGQ